MKSRPQSQYFNRELSWLEFNHRVLEEARDPENRLLERLKFFTIVHSNLDEFFEVRVAGLKQQIESGISERSPDGRTPRETFRAVVQRVRRMIEELDRCWHQELVPALAKHGLRFRDVAQLDGIDREWVETYYRAEVRPVLTPLGIDSAHPFPQLLNKSLNLMVRLQESVDGRATQRLAIVHVPRVLPRLAPLPRPEGPQEFVLLDRLIGHYLAPLFGGVQILGYWAFRVTRNSELYIDEEETANRLKAVETELHNRRRGAAVRLEVEPSCPADVVQELLGRLNLTKEDLYRVAGPMNPIRLMTIYAGTHSPELRDPPFRAPVARALRDQPDLFAAIRRRDLLLHHPYESFESVVQFLEQAAADPLVLAIKQTLYRTGGDARIIGALMNAVKAGKQVTAVVELRARFDEQNNVDWARLLEEAGVHVVYGLVGYKIHSKVTLVVRRDPDGIRRYVHLSTGNYNPTTAKIYTDIGLLTAHRDFGEDATGLFNLLTGLCQFQGMRRLIVAPFELHARMLALIRRETELARQGQPTRIVAKMNSLVDTEIIDALYAASQAGVPVDLIVRGICCLRPGVKGLSERITVRSIVGRFLEHSRIFYFENGARPEVYLGSADWMPRNFFKRIEVVFSVEDGVLREQLISELLAVSLADNVKARHLLPDGTYRRATRPATEPRHNSQAEFIALAIQGAGESQARSTVRGKYPRVKVAARPPFVAGNRGTT